MPSVNFDYTRFYVMTEAFRRGAFRVHPLDEIPIPNLCAVTRAEVVPGAPLRFHHDEGTHLCDYIGTTAAVITLVSDRLVGVLHDHRVSGWTTYPVEVYDDSGARIAGYHGLAVSGRSGPIDEDLSPVAVVPPPVPRGAALPHRIGLRFWPHTWDGSDVFSPDRSAFMFVTQRVRDALVKAKVTNVDLRRITEVEQLVA